MLLFFIYCQKTVFLNLILSFNENLLIRWQRNQQDDENSVPVQRGYKDGWIVSLRNRKLIFKRIRRIVVSFNRVIKSMFISVVRQETCAGWSAMSGLLSEERRHRIHRRSKWWGHVGVWNWTNKVSALNNMISRAN